MCTVHIYNFYKTSILQIKLKLGLETVWQFKNKILITLILHRYPLVYVTSVCHNMTKYRTAW